jgi:hypothetical protein
MGQSWPPATLTNSRHLARDAAFGCVHANALREDPIDETPANPRSAYVSFRDTYGSRCSIKRPILRQWVESLCRPACLLIHLIPSVCQALRPYLGGAHIIGMDIA